MAIRTTDGTQYKRIPNVGDMYPTATGFQREVATYTATGGETSINLALLSPALSYMPGRHQLSIKRSSGGSLMSTDFQELSSTSVGFSGDPLVAGEVVEITKEFTVTGVMAVEPRPDCYTATATTGQTTVAADFSWTYNAFPSKGIGATRVYLNGVLQYRGTDYTEVGLGTSMTNTIQFVDPLLGGENIILLPTNQVIDDAGASTQFNNSRIANLQSMMTAGSQGFVDQSSDMVAVQNTAIVGRAKIPNLANDLRASLGVERIIVSQLNQLQDEFGQAGEPVFSAVNDDRGLIRLVGGWLYSVSTSGQSLSSTITTDYIEVTFYGTGLNMMIRAHGGYSYYLDGSGPTVIAPVTLASILDGRNYSPNIPVNICSTTLGLHTVRILATGSFRIFGFEILNANASGLVNINTGTGYSNGQKYVNSLVDGVSYKGNTYTFTITSASATAGATYTNNGQTFTVLATVASGTQLVCSGTGSPSASGSMVKASGTGSDPIAFSAFTTGMARGGRVVQYLNSDGSVGQAFTAVNAAQANLTSADHTNEETVRTYNFREFGAGRADDFSLLTSTARAAAFTLDDGTTTLVGDSVIAQSELLQHGGNSNYITFTFVGTGLDIVRQDNATGTAPYTFSVDGGSATALNTNGSTARRVEKIASGLAYGTHTVKITRVTSTTYALGIAQFIVYQPKKPAIPATALELCDYNVMGDYTASVSSNFDNPPSGALRKVNTREVLYYNTWVGPNLSSEVPSGFTVVSNTASSYWQLTYFGYGVELLGAVDTLAVNQTVSIDDSSVLTGSTLIQPGTGLVWTASTGTLSGTSTVGGNIRIIIPVSTLSAHKVKLLVNSGYYTYQHAIDIITPIHSTKSNLYADLQNTLPVGSCSLMDSRKTSMIKEILPASKSWAQAVGIASGPTTNVASAPVPDMSVTIKTSGGPIQVTYALAAFINNVASNVYSAIFVNGSIQGSYYVSGSNSNNAATAATCSVCQVVPVPAGVHKVDLYWGTDTSYTATSPGIRRILTVQEL